MDKNGNLPVKDISHIFLYGYHKTKVAEILKDNIHLNKNRLRIKDQFLSLDDYRKITLIGAGTASVEIAGYLGGLLQERIYQGVILSPPGFEGKIPHIKVCPVTDPLTDERSYRGLRDVLYYCENASEEDLIILFLSKGAMEFLEILHSGITPRDYELLVKKLKNSGANARETHAVMKHMSLIKGGQLLRYTHPASTVSLIFSDAPGGDLSRSFSGPTYPDDASYRECRKILIRHKLPMKIPSMLLNHFNEGLQGKKPETVKTGDPVLGRITNIVMSDSNYFAECIKKASEEQGFKTLVINTFIEGSPAELGDFFSSVIKSISRSGHPCEPPCIVIASGKCGDDSDRIENLCRCGLRVAKEIHLLKGSTFLAGTSFQFSENKSPVACMVTDRSLAKILEKGVDPFDATGENVSFQLINNIQSIIHGEFNPNDSGDVFIMAVE